MSVVTPVIGIVGGFGPETSVAFCHRIVAHSHRSNAVGAPAFMMDMLSVAPSVSKNAIEGSHSAAASLVEAVNGSIERLRAVGVRYVTIPCNTLHLFSGLFHLPAPLHLVHIVDATLEELKERRIGSIGLLATGLTVLSGLYANRCAAAGICCLVPSEGLQQELNRAISHYVRTGKAREGTADTFRMIVAEFRAQNLAAVVLGCTDLSGILQQCGFEPPLACIDSMDALAKSCARLAVSWRPSA